MATRRAPARRRTVRRRNGLDHGVLNVPLDKRGGGSIDAQIDRWKRERAAAAKVERKTAAAKHKADKAEALDLLAIVGDAVAEQFAARHPQHTEKATKAFLTRMAKDEPAKAITFFTRLVKEYGLDEPRSNPRRRNGVTGLSASVERDDLSGGWAVYIHDGRRTLNMTDDYFASKAGAEREAKKMLAQARAGVSLDTLAAMFYEANVAPFRRAERELANPRRRRTAARRRAR